MTDKEVLTKIRALAKQENYIITTHAKQQAIDRHMKDLDIKNILLNPSRVVRRDNLPNEKEKYKIQGSKKKRNLAVVIENCLVVITVM